MPGVTDVSPGFLYEKRPVVIPALQAFIDVQEAFNNHKNEPNTLLR